MKKLRIYKLIQTAFLLISALGVCVSSLMLGSQPEAQIFFQIIFWILLIFSFVFILVDLKFFADLDTHSYNLRKTAYVDPLTGLLNRTGVDQLARQLENRKELPEMGCVALELTNLFDINDTQGHVAGDRLVRRFGALLTAAAGDGGYACRNSATRFLVLLPRCEEEKLEGFLGKVEQSVAENNDFPGNPPIVFVTGKALNSMEKCMSSSDLIARAFRALPGE